jgi:hypothetical protein
MGRTILRYKPTTGTKVNIGSKIGLRRGSVWCGRSRVRLSRAGADPKWCTGFTSLNKAHALGMQQVTRKVVDNSSIDMDLTVIHNRYRHPR